MKRFAKEDEFTRISRDVFLYDSNTMEFLVTPWGKESNHRSATKYGNAFGVFLCRPPKNESDLAEQRKFSTELFIDGQGVVLQFDVSKGVVGHKTNALNALLKRKFEYDRATFECVVMPSTAESATSSISSHMTVLAYFLPVDASSIRLQGGLTWLSMRDATDPTINVHASVVQTFLYRRNVNALKTFEGANVASIQKRLSL